MSAASAAQLAAIRVLHEVVHRRHSLDAVLEPALATLGDRDRPLAAQLCYGTLRWHLRLGAVLGRLLNTPLRARDRDVESLLLLGLYELDSLATPDYAVVDRSVETARALGKPWAARLVNALLRRFSRERETLLGEVDEIDSQRLATPSWLLQTWQQEWPDAWLALAEASNRQAPMALRVNGGVTSRQQYAVRLEQAGIAAHAHAFADDALVLEKACDVRALPGFAEGLVSVQDPAAQLAADLLQLRPQQRVLDACAAPGGKTCHIGEREPQLAELLALEIEPRRARLLRDNIARCGVVARVLEADALHTREWWDGNPFQRILLDAPCTGTGVIRRHPDIKHLRRPQDMARMAKQQGALLDALWPTLAQDGMLLYATCSVSRGENQAVIAGFLDRRPDAREDCLTDTWGVACDAGRQLLPGTEGVDGFYYARLRKTTARVSAG
jgi:16S rRNA (cytosine967-C5)-methyltransferase